MAKTLLNKGKNINNRFIITVEGWKLKTKSNPPLSKIINLSFL